MSVRVFLYFTDRVVGYISPALWIGLNELIPNHGFHWTDGAGFGFINWAPGTIYKCAKYSYMTLSL